MQANDLRKGNAIMFNNEIHLVEDFRHCTPGNKRGFIQATLRSLKTNRSIQYKFQSFEAVESAPLIPKAVQFLYKDGDGYHFMNLEDYHSFMMTESSVGDAAHYLKENQEIKIRFHEENPIAIDLPSSLVLKVVESAPGVRGDSVSNTLKPAKVETGYELNVPLFVNEGDLIKIDTRTGEYLGRA